MRVFVFETGASYVRNIVEALSKHVTIVDILSRTSADVVLSLQMGGEDGLISYKRETNKPIITYVWDCYDWIWEHDRSYNWQKYGNLIKISNKVLTPSQGQIHRLQQHWNIPLEKTKVVKAYAQYFDYDEVQDKGYVCNPLREIPDRHLGWVEKACEDLDIPYEHGGRKRGQTGRSWEEYKRFIAESSFIICPWYEASTGGMSLLEGYNLGKEVLICNSPYMGARDYFGDRAHYFEPSFRSMKSQIKRLWEERPQTSLEDRKEFCSKFNVEALAQNLYEEILQVYDGPK